MKYTLLLVAVLGLFINSSIAQEEKVPDYNTIEKNIKIEGTNLYYPALLQRFIAGDSTFTVDELQHVYFGYQFQSGYSAFGASDYEDSLGLLLNKSGDFTKEDYRNVIRFGEQVIKQKPFDCMNYLYVNFALSELKEGEDLITANEVKAKNIIDAIESTGSGLTYESRFYVIEVAHEYNYLGFYGFRSKSQSLIQSTDYLELQDNKYDVKGLYFDVSASFNQMKKLFEQSSTPTLPKKDKKKK